MRTWVLLLVVAALALGALASCDDPDVLLAGRALLPTRTPTVDPATPPNTPTATATPTPTPSATPSATSTPSVTP